MVIPCYNEENTISPCLDAVLQQADNINEIIVVENNSTDSTLEILRSYAQRYPIIKLLTESTQGVQFARNKGFNEAKSDIIGRIDADTIVDPDWAAKVLSYYSLSENKNVGVASGRSWYYDLPFRKAGEIVAALFTQSANKRMAKEYSVYGSNMALRRDAWEKIKNEVCMSSGIMEDQDLAFHMSRAGYSTGIMRDVSAGVSGRRIRMSPLRFWKFNGQWWRTFHNHGLYKDAWKIRVVVWLANVTQAIAWVVLLFHNPKTNTIGIVSRKDKQKERAIP